VAAVQRANPVTFMGSVFHRRPVWAIARIRIAEATDAVSSVDHALQASHAAIILSAYPPRHVTLSARAVSVAVTDVEDSAAFAISMRAAITTINVWTN
jgi:hypothetical protein